MLLHQHKYTECKSGP